jgi:hypothetical protein
MGKKRKSSLPFDSDGGVIVIQRRIFKSRAYLSLRSQAKTLLPLLQLHWRNDKPVDYGIQEAAEKIPCDRKTAMKIFKELQDAGFIECVEQSMFYSRGKSRTRGWRLTWLPFKGRPPTNDWEKIGATGGKTTPET